MIDLRMSFSKFMIAAFFVLIAFCGCDEPGGKKKTEPNWLKT